MRMNQRVGPPPLFSFLLLSFPLSSFSPREPHAAAFTDFGLEAADGLTGRRAEGGGEGWLSGRLSGVGRRSVDGLSVRPTEMRAGRRYNGRVCSWDGVG